MKRNILILGLALVFALSAVALIGCTPEEYEEESSGYTMPSSSVEETKTPTNLTCEQAVQKLQEAGLPVSDVVSYTKDTDPEGLLGKSGEYVSKTGWTDTNIVTRIEGVAPDGAIEQFENEEDLARRMAALQSSDVNKFLYTNGCLLMRLSKNMTPVQAAEYKLVFLAL